MGLFAGTILWNYAIYKMMRRVPAQERRWMQAGVAGNLFILGVFKYFNFGVDSLNAALMASGMPPFDVLKIILPIGISFYIFQSISFLIDIYRKDAPDPKNIWDFAAFISLFPQLIAGPILRYKDVANQFSDRVHSWDYFSEGAYRFMIGFAQKILIADSVAPLVDMMFGLENPTFLESWVGALAYTLQLYFDFMGYSSMAIGLGLMMGFRFMENFNHPYISRSITEFWRRWHISLSTWLRDYLYIPLGGNRQGEAKTYRNLFLTMLLGGAWHGANWTFVIWGAWHGFWLALERKTGFKGGWAVTGFLVVLGWVMFRAEHVSDALQFYQGMAGLNGWGFSEMTRWQVWGMPMGVLILGWMLVFLHARFFEFRTEIQGTPDMKTDGQTRPAVVIITCVLFLMAITKLSAESYSPFLYFQF